MRNCTIHENNGYSSLRSVRSAALSNFRGIRQGKSQIVNYIDLKHLHGGKL